MKIKMKAFQVFTLCALMAFASCGGQQVTGTADEKSRVKPGDKVPEFTVQLTDGSTVNVADLKGKVVLLNFWATWCPYCLVELERVPQDIIERFAGTDLVFIAISREEPLETVVEFMRENGYTFTAGIDPDRSIYDLFAEESIPRNYLINKKGVVVTAEVGYTPEEFEALIDKIGDELKK